jgi:iron complex outermembrane receptor protein
VEELSLSSITGADGVYSFHGVLPGRYSVTFTQGANSARTSDVVVENGTTTPVDLDVDWPISFPAAITVYAASRRTERIVDAPAAAASVGEAEIGREAAGGQLPDLLGFSPGVDMIQSGLYDFNLNTRGFNSALNRRVLTLIDGRDPSIALLGSQEWAAISYPLDDFSTIEMVRGPGSALYGANAFSGVLDIRTKAPRFSQGGFVRLSGGEPNMGRLDARYAGDLGNGWYFKAVGGHMTSEDFTVSRNDTTEYGGLELEAVPLALDRTEITYFSVRFDRVFASGKTLVLETGLPDFGGPTLVTQIGRVQATDVRRPWARLNLNTPHWNFLAYYDGREANKQIALQTGVPLFEDSYRIHAEVQGNTEFAGGRGVIIGGASVRQQFVDTADNNGNQTILADARDEHMEAVFGQVDYQFSERLKAVVAARWDHSSLHEPQLSPRAAVVYSPTQQHSLRLVYSEAFQVPNIAEFFLDIPVNDPVTELAELEAYLSALLGHDLGLGFDSIPVLALGNENLDVEKIRSLELGYSAILGRNVLLTLDYYRSRLEDFTEMLPGVNPAYGPHAPPAELPAPVQTLVLAAIQEVLTPLEFAIMSNDPETGDPIFVGLSFVNAGLVDTQGVELAASYFIGQRWILDFNYTWLNFDVVWQLPGAELVPNAPEHRVNLGVEYITDRFDVTARYRWVDDFPWSSGIFSGHIDSYSLVDLTANLRLGGGLSTGVNISNLLDDGHIELFGGDVLGRRAVVYMSIDW